MLTLEGLKHLGFEPITQATSFSAVFHRLDVLRIHGFTLDDACLVEKRQQLIRGVTFSFGLGNSINELCRRLVDDDYTPDETAWLKEKKLAPPFLVVHLGPTERVTAEAGHSRRHENQLVTYNAFAESRLELKSLSRRLLPQITACLTSQFATYPELVSFEEADTTTFGITDQGETLFDFVIHGNATVSVSRHRRGEEILALLESALSDQNGIAPRAAEYYYLALKEKDELKDFLFFFLSLEVFTHRTFKGLRHQQYIASMVKPPADLANAGAQFFSISESSKSLKERFVWCAMCVWNGITDSDVDSFSKLKRLRDDIAHGNTSSVSRDHVREARALASKVLSKRAGQSDRTGLPAQAD